jgi:hypothetical protein
MIMAVYKGGKNKGQFVEISQWANDWVSLMTGKIVSPESLIYTTQELRSIIDSGALFPHYYPDWEKMILKKDRS